MRLVAHFFVAVICQHCDHFWHLCFMSRCNSHFTLCNMYRLHSVYDIVHCWYVIVWKYSWSTWPLFTGVIKMTLKRNQKETEFVGHKKRWVICVDQWVSISSSIVCLAIFCDCLLWLRDQYSSMFIVINVTDVDNINNNNNNTNIQDNVYGVVIMAEPLRDFTRFIWWMRTVPSGRRLRQKQTT